MPGLTRAPRVLIIGGGYAGVTAANRLRGWNRHPVVTLVAGAPRFVERIRLHQFAAGTGNATRPYSDVLHPSVELLSVSATSIDATKRVVSLSDGCQRAYDWLIYAAGSGAGALPTREDVHRVDTLAAATRFGAALRERPAVSVKIVGGGLTAIETASEIRYSTARLRHQSARTGSHEVTLIAAQRRDPAGAAIQEHCMPWMRSQGVEVELGAGHASVGDLAARDALIVDATGFYVPSLARASGLDVDAAGRLRVDQQLVSLSDSRIIGAGDGVRVNGARLAMSCQTAMPLGATAADVIAALADGEPAPTLSVRSRALCVSLGRRSGFVLPLRSDDVPRSWHLTDRTGAVAKELVCRYTVWAMRSEMRRPGSYRWATAV